ncbi:MAG TPA: hypothetical protein VF407_09600 [Polyangiaceae bacterium]
MKPRAIVLTVFLLALCGCERGCLAKWWEGHVKTTDEKPPQLTGTPNEEHVGCVAGFVRCMGGKIQVSKDAPNAPCTPEGCLCPWEDTGTCAQCVVDGVPFELEADAGAQLCAPENETTVILSHERSVLDAGDVGCEKEGFFCANGVVSSCETPELVRCTHGCAFAEDLSVDVDELRSAALLLCARK